MPCSNRKHTPIVSQKQRGKFGAELARRRADEKPQMDSIATKEIVSHLKESKGKKLPVKSGERKSLGTIARNYSKKKKSG